MVPLLVSWQPWIVSQSKITNRKDVMYEIIEQGL